MKMENKAIAFLWRTTTHYLHKWYNKWYFYKLECKWFSGYIGNLQMYSKFPL